MGAYRTLARPLFFAISPEAAHRLAGGLLRWPLPWQSIGGAVDDPLLRRELAGISLRNPIGLAAGFDKSCRFLPALGELGFGYLVAGTVTRLSRVGNAKPRIVRRPEAGSIPIGAPGSRRPNCGALGGPRPSWSAWRTRSPRTWWPTTGSSSPWFKGSSST